MKAITHIALALIAIALLVAAATEHAAAKKKHHHHKKADRKSPYYHGAGGEIYVAYGDSITRGLGSATPYSGFLTAYREAGGKAPLTLINLGVDGFRAPPLVALLDNPYAILWNSQARYITVSIGFNDMTLPWISSYYGLCGGPDGEECYRTAVAQFKQDWDQILHKVTTGCAPAKTNIAVANIYANHLELGPVHTKYLEEVNAYIETTAAERNIPVADLHTLMNGSKHDKAPPVEWMSDPTHPNDLGAYKIAEVFNGLPRDENCPKPQLKA